ncbi:hypothetical protein [Deinococcus yunweiensis]|uniref:hypothetical protein n=1 Tax=Deinococcus yunweiensis TaxID=367282 RepID=UPI00398EE3D7
MPRGRRRADLYGRAVSAARSLRLTSDLLRARVCAAQGDAAQAAARLQQARRRVRTPTDDVQWWDAAATIHLAAGDAVGSVMALATVQGATPSALHRARAQARRRQAELAPTTPSPAVPRAPGHVDVILLSGVHLRVDGEERATPRDVLPLLLLTYLMTHDGADLAATADLLLPPARTGRAADERRDAARLRGLIARARHLLGDPGAVLVRAGTLSLGRGYTWAADLNTALATPGLPLGTLPGWLACPWLDDLRESQV